MAESGIKINQLPILDKVTGSDIAVVVDHNDFNHTKQVYLSAIANYITPGSAIDLTQINNSINRLTTDVNNISVTINNTTTINNETFSRIEQDVWNLSVNANNGIQNIQRNLENIGVSLNALSSLIDDPELLSSLEEIIDQLKGEDGEASIANLIMHVAEISSKIDDVIPRLSIVEDAIEKTLDNAVNENFNEEHNSIVIDNNDSYEYGYDKYRFANVNSSSYWFTSLAISGTKINTEDEITTVTLTNTVIPFSEIVIESRPYTDTITVNGTTLSNYTIISGTGLSVTNGSCYEISTTFETDKDADNSTISTFIGFTTANSEAQPFPGESTFALNYIPIRAGMIDVGNKSIQMQVSGTSDIDFYWIKNSNIINNENSTISVFLDDSLVAKRKSTISTVNCEDTDLDLIFSKRIKGGTNININLDHEAPLQYEDLNVYNLIGAICPRRMSYEGNPLELQIINAKLNYNSSNAISGLDISFNVAGGFTGDKYRFTGSYGDKDLTFPGGSEFYNIDNDVLQQAENTITNVEVTNVNVGGLLTMSLVTDDDSQTVVATSTFQL